MEEKNELNDIILNKSGSGSNSKKLLLAIATLTLVLIIVLVIMNSLKSESDEQQPRAAIPTAPSAPTEIIDDPLFEPVEVIEEGNNTTATTEDLGQIAQKIKQESFDNAPVQEHVIEPAPAVQPSVPTRQSAPSVQAKPVAAAPAPAAKVEPKPAPKPVQKVVNTPTIKPAVPKTATAVKPAAQPVSKPAVKAPVAAAAPKTATTAPKAVETAPKAAATGGTYYIQVGSFSKEPSKALFDRLNASGLKYTTVPSGTATKVLVGPFQGEKAAREVLGTVRKNIESGAYIVKG